MKDNLGDRMKDMEKSWSIFVKEYTATIVKE